MSTAIASVFCLTYVLIATRRLRLLPIGRPAGALLGAVLMVAIGALTPAESYRAIDHNTILLLFGMMLLTAYLELSGFFEVLSGRLLRYARTPWALLAGIASVSAALSAFLVNDAVCLFMTPVVLLACRRARLPVGPYLIALATSSNIGSAATLVGNPQNMIIGSMSGIPFTRYLLCSLPAAAAGMAVNVALLRLYYGKKLPARFDLRDAPETRTRENGLLLAQMVTLAVIACFFAGFHLGYTALAGVLVLVIAGRKEPRAAFARVDWTLLVFFASLFIVMEGLAKTGFVAHAWAHAAPSMDLGRPSGVAAFAGLMVLGSNLVSNVPMVLLTGPHLTELGAATLGWVLLGFVTTVAGNVTLVGSVANIIVAEGARDDYTLGFLEYLKFGFVSTLLVLLVGTPLVWLVATRIA